MAKLRVCCNGAGSRKVKWAVRSSQAVSDSWAMGIELLWQALCFQLGGLAKVVGDRYGEGNLAQQQEREGINEEYRVQPSRQPRMLPAQSRACSERRCDACNKQIEPPSEPMDG